MSKNPNAKTLKVLTTIIQMLSLHNQDLFTGQTIFLLVLTGEQIQHTDYTLSIQLHVALNWWNR